MENQVGSKSITAVPATPENGSVLVPDKGLRWLAQKQQQKEEKQK